jgi:hypothetical protein
LELLEYAFFNISDQCHFDSIDQLVLPEKEISKDTEHISATVWTINDFPLKV